jgi:hypothetical protein
MEGGYFRADAFCPAGPRSPEGRTCQPAVERRQIRGGAVRSSFLNLAETAAGQRLTREAAYRHLRDTLAAGGLTEAALRSLHEIGLLASIPALRPNTT